MAVDVALLRGVSVVLSFLLVFRADLAYDRYDQGKQAIGAMHGGRALHSFPLPLNLSYFAPFRST